MQEEANLLLKVLKFTQLPFVASVSIVNADVSNPDLLKFLNSSLPTNLNEFELSIMYFRNKISLYIQAKVFQVKE